MNMVKTFAELCAHFKKYRPHKVQLGRSSKLCISELIDMGHVLMEKSKDELREGGIQDKVDSSLEEDLLTLDDIVIKMEL